jgi:peptidyl-prolyl cis-trans isomerase B (cyclophilin B)
MLQEHKSSTSLLSLFFLLLLLLLPTACEETESPSLKNTSTPSAEASNKIDDEVAVIETDMGRIVIEFFVGDAPKHTENFKKLARAQFYDGTAFHRVIAGNIIQGGDPNSKTGDPATWGMGAPDQPTVPAEFTARKHLRGTVSAARRGDDVNSATSQFFVCLTAKPEWDRQYSAFGRVVEGLNVVDIIANSPVAEGTERPVEKVVMKKVTIDKRANYGATPNYGE